MLCAWPLNPSDVAQGDCDGLATIGMLQDMHAASKAFQALLLDPVMRQLVNTLPSHFSACPATEPCLLGHVEGTVCCRGHMQTLLLLLKTLP